MWAVYCKYDIICMFIYRYCTFSVAAVWKEVRRSCPVATQFISHQCLYNHVFIYLTIFMYPYVVDKCDYSKYTDVWKA